MPHKSSMGINAAWHSLISMVIIVVHQTHGRLWLTLWTAEEDGGGLARRGVVICMAAKQALVKPIPWLKSMLIGPITHAPNGRQSQDPGLRLQWIWCNGSVVAGGADGVVNQRCSKR